MKKTLVNDPNFFRFGVTTSPTQGQRRLHNFHRGASMSPCSLRCCPHRLWTQHCRRRTTALAPRAGCMGFFELGPCLQAAALMPLLDACIESSAPCLQFESNWREATVVRKRQHFIFLYSRIILVPNISGNMLEYQTSPNRLSFDRMYSLNENSM